MTVLKEPEPAYKYRARYGLNQWAWLHGRPTDRTFRGRCFLCREKRIMFAGILHRGIPRRTNLICDTCYRKYDQYFAR